jgi:hypothetical protein
MDDRRIHSTTRHTSADIDRANFGTVRKGFDPREVRQYLDGLSREMQTLENRLAEMQSQLAEAQRRAANPVLDEATLIAGLGQQSAAILRSAHDEAARVTTEAQDRARGLFAQAQERASRSLVDGQERAITLVAEAERTATEINDAAREGAERLVDSAKVNGEALIERAREQGRAIVEQSQEARKAVLNDLAVKRKALQVQIEQLRAARDSLTAAVNTVRENVESLLGGLLTSDEGARAAALEALRARPVSVDPTEEELLAGVPLRSVPDMTLTPLDVPSFTDDETPVQPRAKKLKIVPAEPAEEALDAVEEIFARLRKATLEEREATAPVPAKRAPRVTGATATPVDELFARRDDALEDTLAALTRKVKRALQDDQNIMIERLRSVTSMITSEMEDEQTQRTRYAEAASDSLREAALAGVNFATTEGGQAADVAKNGAIAECAADLAVTIVLALRKKIMADGNNPGAERANAAYKEWRGARVERLCTDAARRAFHIGVLAASGGTIRFVAAPWDPPCDACSMDAQSGSREAGSVFPSGQPYPPLHAGCACTVVPG